MNNSFSTLYENFVNRFAQGGFLNGDYVTIKPEALKCPELSKEHKELVKELLTNKTRVRIVNIQAKNANLSALPNGTMADYNVVIAPEIHPGLNGGVVVLPMHCVELETEWSNSTQKPFDDKWNRKNNHQDNINKNLKFSDMYDSGKGTQEDSGKV